MSFEVQGHLYKRKMLGGKQRYLPANSSVQAGFYVDYMINKKRHTKCLYTQDIHVARVRWNEFRNGLVVENDQSKYIQRLILEKEELIRRLQMEQHGGTNYRIDGAFDAFINSKRRRASTKDRTLEGYRHQFNRFTKWSPGTLRTLRDLTPAVAETYVHDMDNSGMNAETINKHVGFLELLWKTLDPTWPNPWKGLHSTKIHIVQHYRRFTVSEASLLYAKAEGEYRGLVMLGYSTGQRLGDIACLKWENVNMEKKLITLIPAKTDRRKSKSVIIPMTAQLHAYLDGISHRAGHVLPSLASTYQSNPSRISRQVADYITKAKIGDNQDGAASFHSFRHTFASMLAEAGASLQVQAALTSHTLPGVVGTYTHPDTKTLREWIVKSIKPLKGC